MDMSRTQSSIDISRSECKLPYRLAPPAAGGKGAYAVTWFAYDFIFPAEVGFGPVFFNEQVLSL